jgi:hypothetical protein
MWLKRKDDRAKEEALEKLTYSRYYEHDGALRAYANRAMVLAFLCVPLALMAVAMAAYVRLQPPTVIRVDATGIASVADQTPALARLPMSIAQGTSAEPTELERRAFVRLFLERYLNFSAESVNRSWADGLNMMTTNLRRVTLDAIEKDNTIGKIHDEQITAVFHLRSIEAAKDDPLTVTAFGVKEVHRVRDHHEATDKLVGEYHIRLITEQRSEQNPGGLLIAEYGEKLIEGERRDVLAHETSLNNPQ